MDNNKSQTQLTFENSYGTLPSLFFTKTLPDNSPNPELVIFNDSLALELGIDKKAFISNQGVDILSGNKISPTSSPIAMAYCGYQFGHLATLGDGRAILLGEHITPLDQRIDIQLKGSGRTTYSRGGDGKATLSSMLREYVMSEAMYGLGIPTTRSLAVIKTGEVILRGTAQTGAILTRTAASHLRVGTFSYANEYGTINDIKSLADYAIDRHYPKIKDDKNPYLSLLENVIDCQARLIAKWNLVGFVHGVLNTDNVTISGETIDYGPCAFMDDYSLSTVFSSIDVNGRYSYGNQPNITVWNMARFAETLLPLIDENPDTSILLAKKAVVNFSKIYDQYWLLGMCHKLGLFNIEDGDESLINRLLELMEQYNADYTNTFKALTTKKLEGIKLFETEEFIQWHLDWSERLKKQNSSNEEVVNLMKITNPAIIPRNFFVEKVLEDADKYDNMESLHDFLQALRDPYSYTAKQELYSNLDNNHDKGYQTYCGT